MEHINHIHSLSNCRRSLSRITQPLGPPTRSPETCPASLPYAGAPILAEEGKPTPKSQRSDPKEPEKWPQIIFRCSRPDWANPRRSLVKHSMEAGSVHSTKTLSRTSCESSWAPPSLKKAG